MIRVTRDSVLERHWLQQNVTALRYGLGDQRIYYFPKVNFFHRNHEEGETLTVLHWSLHCRHKKLTAIYTLAITDFYCFIHLPILEMVHTYILACRHVISNLCLPDTICRCFNTTILDPKQFKSVSVDPGCWSDFSLICWSYFQQNFHNKKEKVTPTPTVLTVGEPKNVWPNSFPATKVIKVCWTLLNSSVMLTHGPALE